MHKLVDTSESYLVLHNIFLWNQLYFRVSQHPTLSTQNDTNVRTRAHTELPILYSVTTAAFNHFLLIRGSLF